jgi:hypothetical protein
LLVVRRVALVTLVAVAVLVDLETLEQHLLLQVAFLTR